MQCWLVLGWAAWSDFARGVVDFFFFGCLFREGRGLGGLVSWPFLCRVTGTLSVQDAEGGAGCVHPRE